jgi:hypothetical protein
MAALAGVFKCVDVHRLVWTKHQMAVIQTEDS